VNSQDVRILTAIERIGIYCAYPALLIGLVVLGGYSFHLIPWTRLFLDSTFMSPNAAVLLCCLSIGTLIRLDSVGDRRKQLVSSLLIGFAGLFAIAVLLEYMLGVDFGIDLILFPQLVSQLFIQLGAVHLGRFALTTAVSLTCLALAALGVNSTSTREKLVSEALALTTIVISGFFLTAYLLGAQIPPPMVRFFALMAPHTSLAIILLATTVLLARPVSSITRLLASRSLGGVLLRWLLPMALLIPLMLGLFNAIIGQRETYDIGFGLAVSTIAMATLFGGVVWWTALQLDRLDSAARAQAKALGESEERFRNIVYTANEGIWILDLAARTTYVNRRLQEMLGFTAEEMLGHPFYDFVAPEYVLEAEGHFASRVEGKVESYDFQFRRKDGTTLWGIVNSTPLKDSEGHFNGVLKMISDITERKHGEVELRQSREALERAQQVAHIGSWEWDVTTDRVGWSAELYRIYGVTAASFDGTFKSFISRVHPDDRELVQRSIGQALETCKSFRFEHRILRPDGEVRYLDARGECLPGSDGNTSLIRGTGQDITERKQAELGLREAQEHFQSLLQNAGMPISVKDLRGRYLLANAEMAEVVGLASASELLGRRDADFRSAELAQAIESTDQTSIQNEDSLIIEEEFPGPDGPRYFWTTKFPMRDAHGTVIGVGDISQEITELRRAEQALRESESLNRSVLEAALDAVVSINSQGTITTWNPQAEELFGWKAEEAIGQPITIIMPERHREAHGIGMQRFRATGTGPVIGKVYQTEAQHRSGREFPVDVAVGQAIVSREGQVSFSAFIRDISERKRAEKEVRDKSTQLEELNSEMQVAIQELANSHQLLQDQAAALERSNTDLDDFAYIASHDLKEPLRGISNYAHFLNEDYADKIDEAGREMLATLPRLTKRLEALLDALLKYSRLNRAEIVPLQTDLNDVVDEVSEMLDARIRENNAHVRVPRHLPTIMCDRSQTTEIFLNLISNGIKYNEEKDKLVEIGYITEAELEADGEAAVLEANAPAAPGVGSNGANGSAPPAKPAHPLSQREMIFYVSDNGIGIPEKFQETVFGAFRRLHNRDKYGGGTGVGLAIVKKMVERQGGRIWVESEPGQGSTFYFTLNPEVALPSGGGMSESRA